MQDTAVYNLKAWLRWRLKRDHRDPGDVLARKLIDDTSIPSSGSYALYVAHVRRIGYAEADRKLFDVLWQEMKGSIHND